jgi:hypothetical protein
MYSVHTQLSHTSLNVNKDMYRPDQVFQERAWRISIIWHSKEENVGICKLEVAGKTNCFCSQISAHNRTCACIIRHVTTYWRGGARGGAAGCGFDFRWCRWNFSLTWSIRPHYGPGVDSASNRNEYQGYYLVVEGGRSLPPSCADCLEVWEPQLLGALRACPGITPSMSTKVVNCIQC